LEEFQGGMTSVRKKKERERQKKENTRPCKLEKLSNMSRSQLLINSGRERKRGLLLTLIIQKESTQDRTQQGGAKREELKGASIGLGCRPIP